MRSRQLAGLRKPGATRQHSPFGLVRNRPRIAGNKRAGFIACVMTFGVIGYMLDMPDDMAIDTLLKLAVGQIDETALAEILARYCAEDLPPT